MAQEIKSRVLKTDLINWRELQFIQDDNFKEWLVNGDQRLFNSLLKYQFIDPFKVWQNDNKLYCLDGMHRYKDLLYASENGVNVPDKLPAILIDCKDMNEAAQLVLVYSSLYAKATQQSVDSFIKQFDISLPDIQELISLPDIRFEELGIGVGNDPNAEFLAFGEFEFVNKECQAFRSIVIHFDTEDAVKKFTEITDLPITDKTKYMFFPYKEDEKSPKVYE